MTIKFPRNIKDKDSYINDLISALDQNKLSIFPQKLVAEAIGIAVYAICGQIEGLRNQTKDYRSFVMERLLSIKPSSDYSVCDGCNSVISSTTLIDFVTKNEHIIIQ